MAIEAHHGNSYDGNTLKQSIKKAEEITNWKAKNITGDLGQRGDDNDGEAEVMIVNRMTMKN